MEIEVQLHTGSESEEEDVVLPIESSRIKRAYDFFRVIRDENMENPWWLCTDVSATISKGKFIKWGAHLLWHFFLAYCLTFWICIFL